MLRIILLYIPLKNHFYIFSAKYRGMGVSDEFSSQVERFMDHRGSYNPIQLTLQPVQLTLMRERFLSINRYFKLTPH